MQSLECIDLPSQNFPGHQIDSGLQVSDLYCCCLALDLEAEQVVPGLHFACTHTCFVGNADSANTHKPLTEYLLTCPGNRP